MKHECIDAKARIWIITLGPDGKLREEIDPRCLVEPSEEIADAVVAAAGRTEIAKSRIW
jgi:hypothetical protein